MDAKLLFWTAALANLAVLVFCGARGVAAVRRGDVRTHRRLMLTATALVFAFLGSYALKVVFLGREDRSAWTALDFGILYVHELCVVGMLAAGAVALYQAWRFRGALGPELAVPSDPASAPRRARHRRAGAIAKWSAVLAFVTACGVWAGMWLRA